MPKYKCFHERAQALKRGNFFVIALLELAGNFYFCQKFAGEQSRKWADDNEIADSVCVNDFVKLGDVFTMTQENKKIFKMVTI